MLKSYNHAYLFTVRLIGGSSYSEGRVEVYYKGIWGTVCNDGWNDTHASLVCTQLGFGSSGSLAYFGPGIGSIYLDNVICSVNDTILANCGHYGVGITENCDHSKDVGVVCIGMYSCTYDIRIIILTLFRYNNSDANNSANYQSATHRWSNVNEYFLVCDIYVFAPIIFLYSNPTDTTSVPIPTPTMNGGT